MLCFFSINFGGKTYFLFFFFTFDFKIKIYLIQSMPFFFFKEQSMPVEALFSSTTEISNINRIEWSRGN